MAATLRRRRRSYQAALDALNRRGRELQHLLEQAADAVKSTEVDEGEEPRSLLWRVMVLAGSRDGRLVAKRARPRSVRSELQLLREHAGRRVPSVPAARAVGMMALG